MIVRPFPGSSDAFNQSFPAFCVLFACGWALFQAATVAHEIKLKNRKTAEYALNPREVYVKQAEYLSLAGTLAWSFGVVLFLVFLEMYLTLAILVVALILAYVYIVPRARYVNHAYR